MAWEGNSDVAVPAGSKVVLFLGAANRDPRRWEDPDHFTLDRDPSGHGGFGMGIHQCVGQHVARLEVDSLLRALLKRIEWIAPPPGTPPQQHAAFIRPRPAAPGRGRNGLNVPEY